MAVVYSEVNMAAAAPRADSVVSLSTISCLNSLLVGWWFVGASLRLLELEFGVGTSNEKGEGVRY